MIGFASNRQRLPDRSIKLFTWEKKMKILLALTFAFSLMVACIQGQDAGIPDLLGRETQPVVTSNISSTASGGVWSSPSTWAGGTVPAASDDVTIVSGATVIIDTAAAAKSITVGGTGSRAEAKIFSVAGGAPAVLKFGETAGFSLTVTNDVTIGANDTLSTGGGNANAHVLTIGGNLTNDGVFDLSTNDNQAGALLVFTGNSSNTFGGTGAVNDILWMTVDKGNTSNNILELAVANFTVQGSTTDSPASAFLLLNHGTLKISGTFTGSHRTFLSTPYEIAVGAGLWLNNPNYTIVAQHQAEVAVYGLIRITAGTYNVGTELDDSLAYYQGGKVVMEGGYLNVAGVLRSAADGSIAASYKQTGGITTTCTIGHSVVAYACFDSGSFGLNSTVSLTSGELVIQNSPQDCCLKAYRVDGLSAPFPSNAILRLGNAASKGPGAFRVSSDAPNLVIDTTAGAHTVWAPLAVKNVDIGPGGKFIIRNGSSGLRFGGDSFVNNGILSTEADNHPLWFLVQNAVYSGSGVTEGAIRRLQLTGQTLTLNSVNNLRVREVEFSNSARIINSNKLTIGNNDAVESFVFFLQGTTQTAGFDAPPVFDLGTGGQSLSYHQGPRTTGVEINPDRRLKRVFVYVPGSSLTIAGGDLEVGLFTFQDGPVLAGPYKIRADEAAISANGYLDGTLILKLTAAPRSYLFPVGQNGFSPITLDVSALGTNPSYLAVSAVDSTLPGLLPATSVSRHWKVEETGDITAGMRLRFMQADIRGFPGDYKAWHSTGGTPTPIAGSFYDGSYITVVTPGGITDFTGNWGVGAQLDPSPVSISGTVTTSGGQPIRNATLTISGGNLPSPVTVQTGNFGTYGFSNLQAGETYTVRVDVKRYRFAQPTQQVTPMNNVGNVNFVASPQE
jgi:hypothetical protein